MWVMQVKTFLIKFLYVCIDSMYTVSIYVHV